MTTSLHPPDTAPYSKTSNPTPHTIKEVVPTEPEQMDIKKLDDLSDVINVSKELLSDFDSWACSVLKYQW